MKKLICCLLAATATYCTNAQPVITAATANPYVGLVEYIHRLNGADGLEGSTGAGVTWNLTAATVSNVDTYSFQTCVSTGYCDSFPGANLAIARYSADTIMGYDYLETSDSALGWMGYLQIDGVIPSRVYNNNIVQYPLSYTTNYINKSYYTYGMWGTTDTTREVDSVWVDGWGTLILPSGTFTNVLRVHKHVRDSSFEAGSTSTSSATYSDEYLWFSAIQPYALAGMRYDYNPPGGSPAYYLDAFYTGVGTGSTSVTTYLLETKFQLSPNPAFNNINVTFDLPDGSGATLTLTDVTGRIIEWYTSLITGHNNIAVNTSALHPGIYIARLQTATGSTTQKFTVIH